MEITKEQIEQWKVKYGRVKKLVLSGIDYYYRPINIDEFTNIQKLVNEVPGTKEEVETVKAGLITPKLPESPAGGVIMNLSEEILKISGFLQDSPPEEL